MLSDNLTYEYQSPSNEDTQKKFKFAVISPDPYDPTAYDEDYVTIYSVDPRPKYYSGIPLESAGQYNRSLQSWDEGWAYWGPEPELVPFAAAVSYTKDGILGLESSSDNNYAYGQWCHSSINDSPSPASIYKATFRVRSDASPDDCPECRLRLFDSSVSGSSMLHTQGSDGAPPSHGRYYEVYYCPKFFTQFTPGTALAAAFDMFDFSDDRQGNLELLIMGIKSRVMSLDDFSDPNAVVYSNFDETIGDFSQEIPPYTRPDGSYESGDVCLQSQDHYTFGWWQTDEDFTVEDNTAYKIKALVGTDVTDQQQVPQFRLRVFSPLFDYPQCLLIVSSISSSDPPNYPSPVYNEDRWYEMIYLPSSVSGDGYQAVDFKIAFDILNFTPPTEHDPGDAPLGKLYLRQLEIHEIDIGDLNTIFDPVVQSFTAEAEPGNQRIKLTWTIPNGGNNLYYLLAGQPDKRIIIKYTKNYDTEGDYPQSAVDPNDGIKLLEANIPDTLPWEGYAYHYNVEGSLEQPAYYRYSLFVREHGHYSGPINAGPVEVDFSGRSPSFSIKPADIHIITGDIVEFSLDASGMSPYPSDDDPVHWDFGDGVTLQGKWIDLYEVKHRFIADPLINERDPGTPFTWPYTVTASIKETGAENFHVDTISATIEDVFLPACSVDEEKTGDFYELRLKNDTTSIELDDTNDGRVKVFIPAAAGLEISTRDWFYSDAMEDALDGDPSLGSRRYWPLPFNFRTGEEVLDNKSMNPERNYDLGPLKCAYYYDPTNGTLPIATFQPVPPDGTLYQQYYQQTHEYKVDTKEMSNPNDLEKWPADDSDNKFITQIAYDQMRGHVGEYNFKGFRINGMEKLWTFLGKNRTIPSETVEGIGLPQSYLPGTGGYARLEAFYLEGAGLNTVQHSPPGKAHPLLQVVSTTGYNSDFKELDAGGEVADQDFYELVKTINMLGDHGVKAVFTLYMVPCAWNVYTNKYMRYGWPDRELQANPIYSLEEFFMPNVLPGGANVRTFQLSFIQNLFEKFYYGNTSSLEYPVLEEEARRAYRNLAGVVLAHDSESRRVLRDRRGTHFELNTRCTTAIDVHPSNEEKFRFELSEFFRSWRSDDEPIDYNKPEGGGGQLDDHFTEAAPLLCGIVFFQQDDNEEDPNLPVLAISCGDFDFGTQELTYIKNDTNKTEIQVTVVKDTYKSLPALYTDYHYVFPEEKTLFWAFTDLLKAPAYSVTSLNAVDPDFKDDTVAQEFLKSYRMLANPAATPAPEHTLYYEFWGNAFETNVSQACDPSEGGSDERKIQVRLYFIEPSASIHGGDRLMRIFSTYRGSPQIGEGSGPLPGDADLYFNNATTLYDVMDDRHVRKDKLSANTAINPFLFKYYEGTDDGPPGLRSGKGFFLRESSGGFKAFDIYSQHRGFSVETTGVGAKTPLLMPAPRKQQMESLFLESQITTPSVILEPQPNPFGKQRIAPAVLATSSTDDTELTVQKIAEWAAAMICKIRKIEEGYRSFPANPDVSYYLPILRLTSTPFMWHDAITFDNLLRTAYAEIPDPYNDKPLFKAYVNSLCEFTGAGHQMALIDNQYYRGDYAANLYSFLRYASAVRKVLGDPDYELITRPIIWEANMWGAYLFGDSYNVAGEHDLVKLAFRDRYMLTWLDRNCGINGSCGEMEFGIFKQMRLINNILDYVGYTDLRKTYKTLKPSIRVDLTYDYYEYLRTFDGTDQKAQEKKDAFQDVIAWVMYSLNNWLNLEFFIDERDGHDDSINQGSWFGNENQLINCNKADNWVQIPGMTDQIKVGHILPQSIASGKRPLYPAAGQRFQAKVWVGGEEKADGSLPGEYENGEVRAVVAYLRSMDNRLNSGDDSARRDDEEFDPATYQLQQWRCIDSGTVPTRYDDKWQLEQLDIDSAYDTHHFRKPRTENSATDLTLYIDADKFKDNNGNNYEYFVISLDKLEHKLHLISKLKSTPEAEESIYTHIEENLPLNTIFDNVDIDPISPPFDNSPVVAKGTLPASGSLSISVAGKYDDPEDTEPPIQQIILNDFVVCVRLK